MIPSLLIGSTFSEDDQLHVTCRKTCFSKPVLLLCSAESLQRDELVAASSASTAQTCRKLLEATGCLVSAAEDHFTPSLA